jgi:hypothetical protein
MMTVDDVLRTAKSVGVAVEVEGYNLVVEYDADPSAQLLRMLRHFKPEIFSALRVRQAEQRSLITQWINEHFISSPLGVCAHCGDGERADDQFVLLFVGDDRADVHASCHQAWREAREAEARRSADMAGRPGSLAQMSAAFETPSQPSPVTTACK